MISPTLTIESLFLLVAMAYKADDHYQWLHIISHQRECDCELALDIDNFQSHCEGTRLILCPANIRKRSQHWRWWGLMLVNRLNGLVVDLEKIPGRNLILAQATDSPSQQFKVYEFDNHIYTDFPKNAIPRVFDVHLRDPSLIGTNATYYMYNMANPPNQNWDIRYVPKDFI